MYDILTDIWKNPGASYSPMPFWYWNGELTREGLVAQMDAFHRKGVDGFVLRPHKGMSGIEYLSDDYFELVQFVCDEAKKRFMTVILSDMGMLPPSSAYQRIAAQEERLRRRRLYCQPAEAPVPAGDEIAYRLWLTMEDGKLVSSGIGPGDGEICYNFILGYGDCGEKATLDFLNPTAVEAYLGLTLDKHYEAVKEHFGQTVIGFFVDGADLEGDKADNSGALPWSYATMDYFFNEGGDIDQIAPLFFETKNKKQKREAEYIYRNAIRKNLADAFFVPMEQACRQKNIALMGYPAAAGRADLMHYFHIPGQRCRGDEETALSPGELYKAKFASDYARHHGLSRSSVVCFGKKGENGEKYTPDDMMCRLNALFARGCSMVIPDGFYYASSDNTAGPDMGPDNIWWQDYRKIAGYIKRLSWLGVAGTNNPTAAVLCSDEHIPTLPLRLLYEQGYTFNYLTLDDFMKRAHVHEGHIHIDRYSYDLVLIDGRLRLDAEIVKKLGHFVTQGGKMYRGAAFGQFVQKNTKKTSYFRGETDGKLRFVQYTKSGCPMFLFVNEGEEPVSGHFVTDLSCKAENFDPFSGKIEPLCAQLTDGGFSYPLEIPAHSVKVIGMDPQSLPTLGVPETYTLAELVSLWEGRMTFDYTPSENRLVKLDFTDLHHVAEIIVNGQTAGRLLFKPYACDITKYLQQGENTVEVLVTRNDTSSAGSFEGCTVRIFEKV